MLGSMLAGRGLNHLLTVLQNSFQIPLKDLLIIVLGSMLLGRGPQSSAHCTLNPC